MDITSIGKGKNPQTMNESLFLVVFAIEIFKMCL